MILSKNVRSKKSPGCLLVMSETTPGFSVKLGSGSGADSATVNGIGSLLVWFVAAAGRDVSCCHGR